MSPSTIGIIIVGSLLFFEVVRQGNQINKLWRRMYDKMDKPPEPSDWDKWKEERAKRPFLTKEELEKVKRESGEI